jgi:tRNA G37 N-methylase TrmD
MKKTLQKLPTEIKQNLPHCFTLGHHMKLSIPDQIAAAMNTMQRRKDLTANDNDEVADVEADDLMDD